MRRHATRRAALLSLPAILDGARAKPAGGAVQGQVSDRPLWRQADGGRLPRRPDPRHAEGLGIEDNTIVVFASDNGPGEAVAIRQSRNARHGQFRPFRGELGEATEGRYARRRSALAGAGQAEHHVLRDVLDHGFPPTFAHIVGGTLPRPADRRRRPDRCLVRNSGRATARAC